MLKISDLHYSVGDTSILNGVSFSVKAGETLGIIGPNGSGKTTLFNCLSGFNKPSQGQILLNNTDITALAAHERAELGIGRVFQNFGIFKEMTLQDNIVTALESKQGAFETFFPWSAMSRSNIERASEYLKEVGLAGRALEKASSLSGGQMRLLEIIRTLAFGANLFLLDEPTAGVSPKMKAEVELLIRKLKELGRTVLIIEHDINFIQRFVDRIIVLDEGRVVLDDAPKRIREHPLLAEIYFGND